MFQNISSSQIKEHKKIKDNFLNADFKKLNFSCNIYSGNFYLDTFNYFLINEDFITFNELFTRDVSLNIDHFFTDKFFNNFNKNINNFKEFKNLFVLGSNTANNFYSNLIQFLPRIFFIKKNNIKIAIHRNLPNNFREFIKVILHSMKINFSFVYLDDGFYKFIDSEFPQFFDLEQSNKILKKFLRPSNFNSNDKKLYITRQDANYRKVINESDIVPILKSKGFKIINPLFYKIDEQIKIFANADKIIAPHGSNLSNIIFCKPKTEIYEIAPNFQSVSEKIFEDRYKKLADINDLKYTRLITDSVPVETHGQKTQQYIDKNFLNKSNYYKHLIVKVGELEKFIN